MVPSTFDGIVQDEIIVNFVDDLKIGVYVFDCAGNSLYANDYFLNIFKYTTESFLGSHFYDFFYEEDIQIFANRRKMASSKHFIQNYRLKARKKHINELQLLSLKQDEHNNWIMKITEISDHREYGFDFFKTFQQMENLKYALERTATVSVTDKYGNIIYVNDKFCEVSKYSRKELYGQNHRIVKSNYHPESFFREMWLTIKDGKIWRGEVCNMAKDGTLWWGDATIVPFLDENGEPYEYVAIRSDITEKKKVEKQIYELAYYDYITGIPNRRMFESDLRDQLNNGKDSKQSFSLMILSLHGMKFINDAIGMEMGDKVIQEVAGRLCKMLERKGKVYRIDGNEFAILISGEICSIETIARLIIHEFETPYCIDKYELFVNVNLGASIFPFCGTDVHSLMRSTYHALHVSSLKGKNQFSILSNNMQGDESRQLALKNDLHKAVLNDELTIYFQPRIELGSNRIIGAEALVRWIHPEFGFLSPGEFIPLAEEEGVIDTIGEIVFKKACAQNKVWQDKGFPPIVVSVNFSVSQFLQSNMIEFVDLTLKEIGLNPQWMEIELTESALIQDELIVSSKIDRLNEMGINTSIDDFGTGYASLSYLKNLKTKILKIDKTFIDGITTEKVSFEIVNGIIQLAKRLNIRTVAEGVEEIGQLNALKSMDCDEIQGYLFSKPLPADEFEKLLALAVCHPAN